ncbi:MAG: tyrosine-type recombinase/integrase [Myxococcales bacterium]|nr:tyrosine-type recombinase/integrase [Myxococcales bacterium]
MASKENGMRKRSGRHAGLPYRYHAGWRIQWVDSNGKRRSKVFPDTQYERPYDEAVADLARIKGELQAIKDGRLPPKKAVPIFEDFIDKYWEPNRTKHKRSPKDDKSILRKHLVPFFGAFPLNQITTEKVEQFGAHLAESNLSVKTVHNVLTLLISIMRYAYDLDFIFRLPKIKKPRIPKRDYIYLRTDAQIRAFLNAARERSLPLFALFATAVYSGLRAGELFGLRWSDVDFKKLLITVQRSFDKPTKTGEVRHVPIVDVLRPILREWHLQNQNDLVFPNEAGNMHTPNPRVIKYAHRFTTKKGLKEVKGEFGAILEAAGLPRMRFHDLRHTFASQWVMRGGDLFKLQKILGHADQQMVQRYAHLAPEAYEKERAIFGKKASKPTRIHKFPAEKKRRTREAKAL